MRLHIVLLAGVSAGVPAPQPVDLIPPGYRDVRSELVFVDSDALRRTRLVAAPIRGFHGVAVVEPGAAFRFSDKYRTRIYALPAGVPLPADYDSARFSDWPSASPPVREVRSAPIGRPVALVRTTCRLVAVDGAGPIVEVVDQESFDRDGNPVDERLLFALLLVVAGIGLAGLVVVGRAAAAGTGRGGRPADRTEAGGG